MIIRAATDEDWPAIWPFFEAIVRLGDTYTYDVDLAEAEARTSWMQTMPGRTIVAVDDQGTVLGTAKTHPNQGGGGAHVANASFMVDPGRSGRGVGRALCEHVIDAARADGYRAIVFNAVVETNTYAMKLYQSLGFEILATIPEGFRHPTAGFVGLHVMYLSL